MSGRRRAQRASPMVPRRRVAHIGSSPYRRSADCAMTSIRAARKDSIQAPRQTSGAVWTRSGRSRISRADLVGPIRLIAGSAWRGRRQLARRAVNGDWSVRDLEAEIMCSRTSGPARSAPHHDHVAAAASLEDTISRAPGDRRTGAPSPMRTPASARSSRWSPARPTARPGRPTTERATQHCHPRVDDLPSYRGGETRQAGGSKRCSSCSRQTRTELHVTVFAPGALRTAAGCVALGPEARGATRATRCR